MSMDKFLGLLKDNDEVILETKEKIKTEDKIEAFDLTFNSLVNPMSGSILERDLFKYIEDFVLHRDKDVIILKGSTDEKKFYAFVKSEFAAFIAGSKISNENFDKMIKEMGKSVEWVYSSVGNDIKKELFDDYVKSLNDSVISITVNDPEIVYPTGMEV